MLLIPEVPYLNYKDSEPESHNHSIQRDRCFDWI